MENRLFRLASILGMTAIILGAFGAHALKKHLDAAQLASFETGVRYQMYHALFLLFVGLSRVPESKKKLIGNLVGIGVLLFSGSIYLLTTYPITGIDIRPVGFITPVGGLLLIVAWMLLLVDFWRPKR
jgi:uncharacterized membrane protein YgdD (TMEM256/DUF423 family)